MPFSLARFVPPRLALFLLVAVALGGCATRGSQGGLALRAPPGSSADVAEAARYWGGRFEREPGNEQVAFAYARALLAQDQRAQAVAILRRAVLANTDSRLLKGELGKALAANGDLREALAVFAQAHSPDRPDWRILSAQGAVLDQLGQHDQARRYYESALRLSPNEPSVLSNLGLSHALAGDLPTAERHLRQANERPNADPRARQNLALVVGLQGRFREAEEIARKDLPPAQAEQNLALIRGMLAERNTWASIRRGGDARPTQGAALAPPEPARAERPRGILAAQALAELNAAQSAPPAAPTTQASSAQGTSGAGATRSGDSLLGTTTRRARLSPAEAEALFR